MAAVRALDPQRNHYLASLVEWLTDFEQRVLVDAGVSSAEELLSLLWNFPSLATDGLVDSAKLSAIAARDASALVTAMGDERVDPRHPPRTSLGAVPPDGVHFTIGETLPLPNKVPYASAVELDGDRTIAVIDKRPSAGIWPVRDQGHRGTCVAHAVTALREHLAATSSGSRNSIPDLSEQFLFWATKTATADPRPKDDGTWIKFAVEALATQGVCDEVDWPYSGTPIPGDVAHAGVGPSSAAVANALAKASSGSNYGIGLPSGNAALLLTALRQCRPVAISLPVFADRLVPAGHNWNTALGTLVGKVLNPPPTAVVIGGHAVCVTGFAPDANERMGGFFVFRNSWGTSWGKNLPSPGSAGPEVGYGQVSASYVDKFLWEFAQL